MQQPLAAIGRIAGDRRPAAFAEGPVGLLEAPGRTHHAILEEASFLIARPIEWEQDLLAELGRFLENRIDKIRRHLLEAGQLGECIAPMQLIKNEAHVAQRSFISRHSYTSSRESRVLTEEIRNECCGATSTGDEKQMTIVDGHQSRIRNEAC